MTLESVCLDQQDIITAQSAMISALLREIALFRALDAEEAAFIANEEANSDRDDNRGVDSGGDL